MKKAVIIFPLVLMMLACNNNSQQHGKNQNTSAEMSENQHAHHGERKSEKGSANEHMHQSSVEDLIKRFESSERDEYQQPEKVMAYLGDITGKRIIDIGAGSGYFSVKLAEKGAKVIAADVDDEFQEFLHNRIQEKNLSNIETRKIPYEGPGLEDKEVDMVFMVNTYHHIMNRSDYFAKVKNGTKVNGELVIIDFFKHETPVGPPLDHRIGMDEVIYELKKAGYTHFEVNVNLLLFQYIIRAK